MENRPLDWTLLIPLSLLVLGLTCAARQSTPRGIWSSIPLSEKAFYVALQFASLVIVVILFVCRNALSAMLEILILTLGTIIGLS